MKIINAAISVLMLASALCVVSCSDEPEAGTKFKPVKNGQLVQGSVDFEVLSRYEASLEDATYTMNKYEWYEMDELSAGKWEQLNPADFCGSSAMVPSSIVVRDGKAWEPMQMFRSSTGPTAFGTALAAVKKKLDTEYDVYIVTPFSVDTDECTLTLDGRKFKITSADSETLVLSFVSSYYGGRTGNGGHHLDIGFYEKSAPLTFNDGKDLGFDSVGEAYDWLIELFRDTFGEEVNRNDLYAPYIYYDKPYFYLSTLEYEKEMMTRK